MVCILDIETSGLDPDSNWITCIGVMDDTGIYQFSSSAADFSKDPLEAEKKLLAKFLSALSVFEEWGPLVTYNGKSFDIPFIYKRLLKAKLIEQLPDYAELSSTNNNPLKIRHIDLMEFTRKLEGRRISKDESANKHCNLYVPRNSPGYFLARIYGTKKVTPDLHAQMLQHNALDLCTTFRMYETFKTFDDFKEFLKGNKNEEG